MNIYNWWGNNQKRKQEAAKSTRQSHVAQLNASVAAARDSYEKAGFTWVELHSCDDEFTRAEVTVTYNGKVYVLIINRAGGTSIKAIG